MSTLINFLDNRMQLSLVLTLIHYSFLKYTEHFEEAPPICSITPQRGCWSIAFHPIFVAIVPLCVKTPRVITSTVSFCPKLFFLVWQDC